MRVYAHVLYVLCTHQVLISYKLIIQPRGSKCLQLVASTHTLVHYALIQSVGMILDVCTSQCAMSQHLNRDELRTATLK